MLQLFLQFCRLGLWQPVRWTRRGFESGWISMLWLTARRGGSLCESCFGKHLLCLLNSSWFSERCFPSTRISIAVACSSADSSLPIMHSPPFINACRACLTDMNSIDGRSSSWRSFLEDKHLTVMWRVVCLSWSLIRFFLNCIWGLLSECHGLSRIMSYSAIRMTVNVGLHK